ncbi:hypothetical protein BN1180_03288 [Peribacillus simplex]|uniref:Uncharacterized protein n=1 Tax=Peribacillus simplex TaxID=1478 RepID=A0AAN2TTL0_9BACI|nr:hypothetical protein BN1180_03288 [Peribacillus simplex]
MHNTTIVVYKCALDLNLRDHSTTFHIIGQVLQLGKLSVRGASVGKTEYERTNFKY